MTQSSIKKQKTATAQSGKTAQIKTTKVAAGKQAVSQNTVPRRATIKGAVASSSSKNKAGQKNADKAAASQQHNKVQTAALLDEENKQKKQKTFQNTDQFSDISRQISAKSVMIMDAQTGQTVYEKDPDTPRQPASTIKIITALIAIDVLKKQDIVLVSHRAAEMPRSKMHLDPEQYYLADDLINAVLLSSANDASVALAERIAGTEDQFAQLMTRSARMWGAKNTVCRTASGLTAEGQQTTARDLVKLFRNAMRHEEFAERISKRSGTTSCGKTLKNHNKALWQVNGTEGGKTGYTNAARQTYVGQFTRDDKTIVVALMGSETMWADLKKLVEFGFQKRTGTTYSHEK